MNRNCLSYWFPKLLTSGAPVPQTEIVKTDVNLCMVLDGELPPGWWLFLDELSEAVKRIGLPCFLRTGQTSGKHNWKNTCHVKDAELSRHVGALVEFSAMADFIGLETNVWVIREFLPTKPITVLPAYGDMPLVKEIRAFVEGGKISCWHPYWPGEAIRQGFPRDYAGLNDEIKISLSENIDAIIAKAHDLDWPSAEPLALKVAEAFADDGAWSVDLLPTEHGWFVTDMAEAKRSFHWPECPSAAIRG